MRLLMNSCLSQGHQSVSVSKEKKDKNSHSSMEEVSSQLQSAFSERASNLTEASRRSGSGSGSKSSRQDDSDSDQEDVEEDEEEGEGEGDWEEVGDVNDIPDSVQQLAWDDDL